MSRTLWNQYTEVRAAKPHWCVWCGNVRIVKGELHLRYVGKFEGDFQDWRIHKECADVLRKTCEADEGYICDNRHKKGKTCDECQDWIDSAKNAPRPVRSDMVCR